MDARQQVILTRLTTSDRRLIAHWLQDRDIVRYDLPAAPPRETPTHRVWAIGWQGETIGWIELYDLNRRAASGEIRICIGRKDLWGQGLGSEAVAQMLHMARTKLKLQEVYLRVATDNRRAIRSYLKCGFRKHGLLRAGWRAQVGHRDHYLMVHDFRRLGAIGRGATG